MEGAVRRVLDYQDVGLHLTQYGDRSLSVRADFGAFALTGRSERVDWGGINHLVGRLREDNLGQQGVAGLGALLGDALLPAPVLQTRFRDALAAVRGRAKGGRRRSLRLRISCADDALEALPWEVASFALDAGKPVRKHLVLEHAVSVVRELGEVRVRGSAAVGERATLLGIDGSKADVDDQVDSDLPTFRGKDSRIRTARTVQARLEEVRAAFRLREAEAPGEPIAIVHFSGHGRVDDATGGRGLVFHPKTTGSPTIVPARVLAGELAAEGVRLVVLSACNSATTGTGAIAQAFARAEIPAVVGMQHPITAEDAKVFSSAFYASLRKGETLDEAVAKGRAGLGRTIQSWFTPVLYLSADTGEFLRPPQAAPAPSPAPAEQTPGEPAVRSWSQIARGSQHWRLTVASNGLARTGVEACEPGRAAGGGGVALAADGRAAAQLVDGRVHVTWIDRITGALEHWPVSFEVLPGADDLRLLAVGVAGVKQVRLVVSRSSATELVRLDRNDGVKRVVRVVPAPSRAAVLLGDTPWTVDGAGHVRDHELAQLLPVVREVTLLDAGWRAGQLLVAAAGRTGDGAPCLLVGSTSRGTSTEVLPRPLSELGVVRQLDPRAEGDCIVTDRGATRW